jgi:hypothetical protein
MKDNGFQGISRDSENAKRGIAPDVLIDTYGNKAPDAARFDKGTSAREGAQEAQDARRNAKPGSYDSK